MLQSRAYKLLQCWSCNMMCQNVVHGEPAHELQSLTYIEYAANLRTIGTILLLPGCGITLVLIICTTVDTVCLSSASRLTVDMYVLKHHCSM